MDHLNAIDVGVDANKPYAEIARKVFLTYPTKVFIGNEELQYEILNAVSENFRVPITCIHVAGSAKLGYSTHKKTEFMLGQSDLDLAIIDGRLFAQYLEIGLKISRNYSNRTAFPVRDKASTIDEYRSYLAKGIFRPDLMPIGQQRAKWRDFFGLLSTKHSATFRAISAAIYISESCFESKQCSAISARAKKETV